MLAHHFKNFLTLLYKLNSVITIYCKNNNKLVCSDTSDNSILYQFEFESPNLLEENKTYVISLPDIHRLFKYIKSSSILFFTHSVEGDISHLIIKSTHENIVQELKFPIIITHNVDVISCYDFNKTFTLKPILIRLNDLSRMIKALKNTADTYEIIHGTYESDNLFKISNIDSIIPVSYCITSPSETSRSTEGTSETSTEGTSETSRIVVNNYSLLRLNKLYCDNSVVKIHKNSINYESENGDVSYYIALENLE